MSARSEPAADGPRWPVDSWISPTALHTYDQCPRRARFKYIDKVPEASSFNLFLLKGRIAHNLLQYSATRISRREPVHDGDRFLKMAIQRLPPREFPSSEAREAHALDIVRWVAYGLDYLDREAEYLAIERGNNRLLRVVAGVNHYTLNARPDVILLRTAPDGERYVEFIDYKTGKPRTDDVVPVVTRYVSREMLKRFVPDPTTTRMQFTYLWLDPREKQVVDLSIEFCELAWETVTEAIRSLADEREWPATPSMLCHYCAYNGHVCTEFRAHMERTMRDSTPF